MTLFGYTFPGRSQTYPPQQAQTTANKKEPTLAGVRPGGTAQVEGFLSGLSSERRAHLQSYGLVPGACVRVLQHSPVTVIQIEHLELALERDVAAKVRVAG